MNIRRLLENPELKEELVTLSNVRSLWSKRDLYLPRGMVIEALEKAFAEQQTKVEQMITQQLGEMPLRTLHEVIDKLLAEIKS